MINKFYVRIVIAIILLLMVVAIPLEAMQQPDSSNQLPRSNESMDQDITDKASSDKASSDKASSDKASSDKASSDLHSDPYVDAIPEEKIQDHWHELIVKWNVGAQLPTIPGTKLVTKDIGERLAKLSVDEGTSVKDAIAYAQSYSEIEYIQPNYRYKLHAIPNDIEYSQQWHHEKINMPRAWDIQKGNTDIVIAVLDTGIDIEHPDLKPNLVPGYNILDPNLQPIDDYGHGTQVAGVLGAVGNNQVNGTGILWNARIMPIKVLDGSGEGDDFAIGQGIRYAVRNGAEIIVLSLGDRLYSQHMEDAVKYAEEEGVLLIAATGNNGSTVNYPAAFPTVLAVGATDSNDRVPSYSNFGPEVDVVAPGQGIYTTTMRGQMTYNSGTSMAAPIVAGIAALILKKYPDMEPWQVRQLLRQSATDNGSQPGWTQRGGYGRVDAYRALTITPTIDLWAPNHLWELAKVFPQQTKVHSALQGVNDTDWFYIDVEHRGKVQVPFQSDYSGISMNWYRFVKQDDQPTGELVSFIYSSDRILEPGRYYIRIRVNNWNEIVQSMREQGIHQNQYNVTPLMYKMEHRFTIAEDRYEVNATINQAAPIDIYQAERFDQGIPFVLIEGTHHRDGDQDWYKLDLPHAGRLSIEVVNNYGRMDPVLTLSKKLTTNLRDYDVVDDHAHGAGEFWQGNVEAGIFYFMVADYQLRSHPVPYQVKLTYTPTFDDRWEPNNTRQDAPTIVLDSDVYAFLDGNQDRDWFVFFVEEDVKVNIELTALLPNMLVEDLEFTMKVYESTQETPIYSKIVSNSRHLVGTENFSPGVYYVQLARNGEETPMNIQVPYKLRVNHITTESVPPSLFINVPKQGQVFATIRTEIVGKTDPGAKVSLNGKDVVVDQDGRFSSFYFFEKTGAQTLRFQSTNLAGKSIEKTIQTTYQPPVVFTDLATTELRKAVYLMTERMIIQGYPDKTFRPERSLTRGEMVTLILRMLNVDVEKESQTLDHSISVREVEKDHWAVDAMQVAVERGLIIGFADLTLRPDETVTRAQVATILQRAFQTEYDKEFNIRTLERSLVTFHAVDVHTSHWAYEDINRSVILGYMTTVSGQNFLPDQAATRQQIVNALYQMIEEQ